MEEEVRIKRITCEACGYFMEVEVPKKFMVRPKTPADWGHAYTTSEFHTRIQVCPVCVKSYKEEYTTWVREWIENRKGKNGKA